MEAAAVDEASPYSYVDDVIIAKTGDTPMEAVNGLQEATNGLNRWTEVNKMSVQPDKGEWMIASRGHFNQDAFTLVIRGSIVPLAQQVKYLGTIMDRKMTMNGHIEHLVTKGIKSLALLRFAAAQHIQQKSLLQLMKATVESRIEYGLHLCMCASEQALTKLQRIQNQAMRIVTGAAKPTPINSLQFMLGCRSIRSKQKVLAAQAFLRAAVTSTHPLYDHLRQREDERTMQRLKTVRSWVIYARELIEDITPVENIQSIEWTRATDLVIHTEVIGGRHWRERADCINQSDVLEWLENQSPTSLWQQTDPCARTLQLGLWLHGHQIPKEFLSGPPLEMADHLPLELSAKLMKTL